MGCCASILLETSDGLSSWSAAGVSHCREYGNGHRFAHPKMDHLLRGSRTDFIPFQEAVMVQQAFDVLFVLALAVPPGIVIICAALLAVLSRGHRTTHAVRAAAHA